MFRNHPAGFAVGLVTAVAGPGRRRIRDLGGRPAHLADLDPGGLRQLQAGHVQPQARAGGAAHAGGRGVVRRCGHAFFRLALTLVGPATKMSIIHGHRSWNYGEA